MERNTERQQEYLIGDVARIVGMSRDALRFYEKEGILRAQKKENGYRYYSENDIYKLVHIRYHRKMNSSLKDIEEIMVMDREDTVRFMKDYLHGCMEKEREELKNHKRTITRLKLVEHDIKNIETHLGSYSLKLFPASYIVNECRDLQDGLKNWFHLSSLMEGMDMTYFYTELSLNEGEYAVKNTRLLLYKKLEKELKEGFDMSCFREMGGEKCIYTIVETDELLPDHETILKMASWGRGYGLTPEDKVYINNVTSFSWKETPTHCMELYMPVSGSNLSGNA